VAIGASKAKTPPPQPEKASATGLSPETPPVTAPLNGQEPKKFPTGFHTLPITGNYLRQ